MIRTRKVEGGWRIVAIDKLPKQWLIIKKVKAQCQGTTNVHTNANANAILKIRIHHL